MNRVLGDDGGDGFGNVLGESGQSSEFRFERVSVRDGEM